MSRKGKGKAGSSQSGFDAHFVLIPHLAMGHLSPMRDMACALASHGAMATIITTPNNAARIQDTIQSNAENGMHVYLRTIDFPAKKFKLPEGCESLDRLPDKKLITKFNQAIRDLREPAEKVIKTLAPRPTCIISDKYQQWTMYTAEKFKLPRIIFNGMNCLSWLTSHILHQNPDLIPSNNEEPVELEHLNPNASLLKSQLPGEFIPNPHMEDEVRQEINESVATADGVVINTFRDLEPNFISLYSDICGKPVWCVGPLSLCKREPQMTNETAVYMDWLDRRDTKTVVYACFGSLCRLGVDQLMELGKGLESSGVRFVWGIQQADDDKMQTLERKLERCGFEGKVRERGLVIHGWAPQTLILNHRAVGGVVTHCGWNSTLEAISAGLPMVTWPLFSEQFLNEKLVVDVLQIGVPVGATQPVRWGDKDTVLVRRDKVSKAVKTLMLSKATKKLMERAANLQQLASLSVGDSEGASFQDTRDMIQTHTRRGR